jgi:hypothetical protein
MIIDPQPPEAPRRRWPFLLVWSLAATTMAGSLFLTHTPASQDALVAENTPPTAPTTASTPPSSSISVQRVPTGKSRITLFSSVSRQAQGSITYLDNTGTWIAVGPNDNLLIPPDSKTADLR